MNNVAKQYNTTYQSINQHNWGEGRGKDAMQLSAIATTIMNMGWCEGVSFTSHAQILCFMGVWGKPFDWKSETWTMPFEL